MLPMWLPSGLVNIKYATDEDMTLDNLGNLINTDRYHKKISVSDHCYITTLICAKLLKGYAEISENRRNKIIVQCLFHDCEEAFTGDIPTPLKTEEIKNVGDKLRKEIFNYLSLETEITESEKDVIKFCDFCALIYEIKDYEHFNRLFKTILLEELNTRIIKVRLEDRFEFLSWIGLSYDKIKLVNE